ncbi:MAG: NAD-dependent epimerase/dehydratase family protein [Lentisphaerae bacterium]|nr:NAD-dependent epimerase/dehydratase family protein [Lentisphaerota bacterium]
MKEQKSHPLAGAKVLVTGASGFTGSVLTGKLAAAGARLRAIARPTSRIEALAGLPVEWFRGQVFDPGLVARAAEGVEYVFHVAAAFREAKNPDDYYREVHVDSTQLLARAVVGKPQFRRFVHVSTIGVHGHIENPPADEESPFRPGDVYQRTKAEAELWIRDFARASGLPLAVIRPAAIYGPGDRRLLKLFKMACWPVFPLLGSGKCLYHLVHVEDLAEALILAATHPAALGDVFIAGSREPIAMADMARIVAGELGRRARIVRIPVGPFFAAAAVCEAVCKPLGIEPPLYRRRVAFYTKDRAFRTDKIRDRLGFECRYSNEEGIRMTARWYRDAGWLRSGGRRKT